MEHEQYHNQIKNLLQAVETLLKSNTAMGVTCKNERIQFPLDCLEPRQVLGLARLCHSCGFTSLEKTYGKKWRINTGESL